MGRWQEGWRGLAVRERRALLAALAAVLAAAVYAGIWEPGEKARRQLEFRLAEKRGQLQQMQVQSAQVAELRRIAMVAKTGADALQTAVETSARLHGMAKLIARLEAAPEGGALLVSVPAVSFESWVAWVQALQSEHHIRLARCQIEALATPGMVRIEASFAAG